MNLSAIAPAALPRGRTAIARLSLCALLLFPVAARAGQGSNGPVMLKMKFKPGDVSRYQMTLLVKINIPNPGQPPILNTITMSLVQGMKVNKSLPNGGGEVAVTMVNGSGSRNGQPFVPALDSRPITMNYDARGNILSAKGTIPGFVEANSLLGLGAMKLQGVHLPANPVRPGDAWTQKVALPGIIGASAGTVRSTFLKVENYGHFQTARIQSVLVAPLKILIDGNMQPTKQASQAIGTMVGPLKITFDNDFAISEGKLIRSAGHGGATIMLKLKTPPQRSSASHPSNQSKTPQRLPLTMQLQFGSNLIE